MIKLDSKPPKHTVFISTEEFVIEVGQRFGPVKKVVIKNGDRLKRITKWRDNASAVIDSKCFTVYNAWFETVNGDHINFYYSEHYKKNEIVPESDYVEQTLF